MHIDSNSGPLQQPNSKTEEEISFSGYKAEPSKATAMRNLVDLRLFRPNLLPKNINVLIDRAWKTIDRYKQYPIYNRALSVFFATDISKKINFFIKEVIKDASIEVLREHIDEVFATLKISAEHCDLENQPYLYASIAGCLAGLIRYTRSRNNIDSMQDANVQLIFQNAESFALWGTGGCGHVASLMCLLLANLEIRPLEVVSLDSASGDSGHCIVLIGREQENSLQNLYDSDTLVVDYWSGCVGVACILFGCDGPLASFKGMGVSRHIFLDEKTFSLPQFILPDLEVIDYLTKLTESFHKKFVEFVNLKLSKIKNESTDFQLKERYQKRASKINFHEELSCYAHPLDKYDTFRQNTIDKFGPHLLKPITNGIYGDHGNQKLQLDSL